MLQKRALCLLYFTDWHNHTIPLFLEANLLPMTFRYHESVSILFQCAISIIIKPQLKYSIYFRKHLTFTHTIHDQPRPESFTSKVPDQKYKTILSLGLELRCGMRYHPIWQICLRKHSKEFFVNCYLISQKKKMTIFKPLQLLRKSVFADGYTC